MSARKVISSQSIMVGPDGNLWFTERYADQIGRITITGHVTEFPIPNETGAQLEPVGVGQFARAISAGGKENCRSGQVIAATQERSGLLSLALLDQRRLQERRRTGQSA